MDDMKCCVEAYFKIRKSRDYQDSYHQIGYCVFEPFKLVGDTGSQNLEQLIKGSPRELLMPNKLPKGKAAQGKMEFKFIDNVDSVIPLKDLIPPNTLLGKTDNVPGLDGNKMKVSKPKDDPDRPANLKSLDVDVYLNNPDI